jgi:hypothetical protein
MITDPLAATALLAVAAGRWYSSRPSMRLRAEPNRIAVAATLKYPGCVKPNLDGRLCVGQVWWAFWVKGWRAAGGEECRGL